MNVSLNLSEFKRASEYFSLLLFVEDMEASQIDEQLVPTATSSSSSLCVSLWDVCLCLCLCLKPLHIDILVCVDTCIFSVLVFVFDKITHF